MNKDVRIKGSLAGRILRVDLTTGRTWTEASEPYASRTLGGRGTNSLLLINEIEPGTKWDDSKNLLCFGVGSLVGTAAPGACRTDISTINVFSGGKGSANVGGSWGAELKYAGYDLIILDGPGLAAAWHAACNCPSCLEQEIINLEREGVYAESISQRIGNRHRRPARLAGLEPRRNRCAAAPTLGARLRRHP